MTLASQLKGFNDANATVGGVYLTEGNYTVKITDVKHLQNSFKLGEAIIVNFEVVRTSDETKHPVGAKRSSTYPLVGQNKTMSFSNLMAFVLAANGVSPGDDKTVQALKSQKADDGLPLLESQLLQACENKILNGKTVIANVRQKTTQKDKIIHALSWEKA